MDMTLASIIVGLVVDHYQFDLRTCGSPACRLRHLLPVERAVSVIAEKP
jgi:hypothetical protein